MSIRDRINQKLNGQPTQTNVTQTPTNASGGSIRDKINSKLGTPVNVTPTTETPAPAPTPTPAPKPLTVKDYFNQKGYSENQYEKFKAGLPKNEKDAKQRRVKQQKETAVNTGKAFSPEVVQYLDDSTRKKLTEGKPFWDNETKSKYNVLSKKEKEAYDVQKQLYDYTNSMFKNNKDNIKSALQYSEDRADRKRKQTISAKNNNMFIPEGVYEFLKGAEAGTSFGASQIGEDKELMKARNESPWYSPYNLGKMGGSILPIGLAGNAIGKGLAKVAPKAFGSVAGETAKQAAARRIANTLTADTIAGVGYGVTEETLDAALDTRKDGAQTFAERAKKVGTDAALGLGIGVGVEAIGLGLKGIKNVRDTKKAQKFIEGATKELNELNRKVAILNRADSTIGLNDVKRRQLGELELKREELGWQIDEARKIANPKEVVEPTPTAPMPTRASSTEPPMPERVSTPARTETTAPDAPAPAREYEDAVRQANELINNVRNLRIDTYSRKEMADAQKFADDVTVQLQNVNRRIALLNVQDRRSGLNDVRRRELQELQSVQQQLTNQLEQAQMVSKGGNVNDIVALRQFVDEHQDLYTGDFNFAERQPTRKELPDIARNILMNRNGLIEKFMETGRQQQRTTLAGRLATVLKQQEDAKRTAQTNEYSDFWQTADLENPQQNPRVAEREQVRAEEVARAELPYPDVPTSRDGRIEYVIDNAFDYVNNSVKKSERVTADANAKLEELQTTRREFVSEKEAYLKDTANVERAIREYEDWVKFVQTVNALTREGKGIKLGRGQKVPSSVKRGSIPIQSVADNLGISVDELIGKLNVYQRMLNGRMVKQTTIAKKKRRLAVLKLSQEQAYKDIQTRIEQVDELIAAVEDIKPQTYEYQSRTTYEDDPDYNPDDDPFGTGGEIANVSEENEMFSGYLIEKWYPESVDEYRKIESQIEQLENKITEQENIINEERKVILSQAEILANAQGNEDTLARMLVEYVRQTRRTIHWYSSEEDYWIFRRKGVQMMTTKDLPFWTRGLIQMKPSRKYRRGRRLTQSRDGFFDYVRENLFDGGMDLSRRTEEAGDLFDEDTLLYNSDELLERAIQGNPEGSLLDSYDVDRKLDLALQEYGAENPRLIIVDLKRQIEDLQEKLVEQSKNVIDNRLGSIGELPDSEIVSMVRDVKGEQTDFEELLTDYMNEMYPDRVVPDIEPIRLDTPAQPAPAQAQSAPRQTAQAPATPTNELPVNTPNQTVQPAFNNIPSRNTQTPSEAQNTGVQTLQETVSPAQTDAPAQTVDEPMPIDESTTPDAEIDYDLSRIPDLSGIPEPPVASAGTNAPINQPDFAENLREEGVDMTGDYLPDIPVDERLERGFNRTARTSPNTPEPLREEVQKETDANEAADLADNPSWYAQKPNVVLVNKAIAEINKRGEDEVYEEILGRTFITDILNAQAQVLIKRFIQQGKLRQAMQLIAKVSKIGTELGRAVQAFSLYNKLDVDGVLLMAQRALDKRNKRNEKSGEQLELSDIDEQVQTLLEVVQKIPLIDEVRKLALQVQDLIPKKAKADLTPDEANLLKQFEEAVQKLSDQFPKPPTPKEVIEAVSEIEPRLRKRDEFIKYMEVKAEEARKRLNKNRNRLSSTPFDQWKDYVIIGASYFAKGVIKFSDFSEQMIKAHGEKMKPYMNKLYMAAIKMYRKERGLPSTEKLETSVKRALSQNKIDEETADNLLRMAMEVGYFSDEFRVELLGELQKGLRNIEGTSFLRKVATAQTIAQLLNPKTLMRNALGNEMFWRLEQINKLGAVGIDFIRSKWTGNERNLYFFTNNQESYFKNFMIGAKAGWKGYSPDGLNTAYDLDAQVFTNPKNPFYWLEKALGVTLRSFDYAGYKRAYGSVVGEWATSVARREGLSGAALKARVKELAKNADDEITAIADEYGRYVTFQDDTILAQSFQKAKQALNLGKDFGLGDLIIKYPTTPANLLMRAIDYSPVGIWRGINEIRKARLGKEYDPRLLANALSRSLTGSGITALAMLLAELGVLTGSAHKDADIRELEKSSGMLPYAVNVDALFRYADSFDREQAKRREGDRFMTYDWMQPMAVSVAMGVTTDRLLNEKDAKTNIVNRLYDLTDAGLTTFMEQPLISGVSNLFKTYPDQSFLDKLIGGPVGGLPSSFVPTLSGQFRQLADNNKRLTFDNKNLAAQSANKVLDRLPFASKTLPVSYDAFGRPIERYQDKGNEGLKGVYNVFFNPSFVSKYKPLPEAKTALELYERTNNKVVAPRLPEKALEDYTKKSGKLTKEQLSELTKMIGKEQTEILKYANKDLNDPNISDKDKVIIYERLLNVANQIGRQKFREKTNYKASP